MTVNEQIIEVLNFLGQKFGIAIDWTSESVMPVIQNLMSKYIKYEMWTSIFWVVLIAVCVVAYIAVVKLCIKHYPKLYESDLEVPVISIMLIVGVCGCICGLACGIEQITDIINCITFPEMQIAEYVASLMGKG